MPKCLLLLLDYRFFPCFIEVVDDGSVLMVDVHHSGLGLILQGHLLPAIDFVYRHNDCFFDVALLSTVSKLYPLVMFFFSFFFKPFLTVL